MVNECHLLWGDVIYYGWGPTNQRIKIPQKNYLERQTYYGAIDDRTKEFYYKVMTKVIQKIQRDFGIIYNLKSQGKE